MPSDVTAEFLPIHEARSGRLHGFEARARGANGEHFRELYASAIQADGLAQLDRLCLRTALVEGSPLNADYRLFVNVFPSSIDETGLLSELDNISLRPEQIVFQIVPFEAIQDYPRFLAALAPALQRGCAIAMGGFGTGFSSLSMLSRVPVQYVKADSSFLQPDNPDGIQALQSMAGLAKSLGISFVVAGCDTDRHLATALDCGAELVQGSYVGKSSDTPRERPSSLSVLRRVGD